MINPGLRFGRYEVGARLGKGGFGVVHVARDVELGRDLAIKFLKPEYLMRPQIVQRFLQEARAAAKIGHPGIVTVFECGHVDGTGLRVDGTAFIAMELLRGESLADRLLNGGRLAPARAIAIARQLADALGAAHEASIIHRDLKPDNVFLVPDAAIVGGDRVKVLDFGVAKLAEPGEEGVHTHSQVLLGTPRYMSPEQSRSATKIDTRSDIYALGCILYELVAGRTPFDGDSGDLIAKHQRDPVPSLRAIAPVPEAYARLVEQMLEKSPDARPQRMAHVAAALAAMDGSHVAVAPPAVAPPPGEADPTVATIHRGRRTLAIAAGAVLVIGAIAIAASLRGGGARAGRDAAVAVASPPPPPVADAAPEPDAPTTVAIDDTQRQTTTQCMELKAARKWAALETCANALAPHDAATAATLGETAAREARAEVQLARLRETSDPAKASTLLAKIPEDSVYRVEAVRIRDALPPRKSAAPPDTRVAPACDASKLKDLGDSDYSAGDFKRAMRAFASAYACSHDGAHLLRAYQSACKGGDVDGARTFFRQLPREQRENPTILQICMGRGVDPQ